MDNRERLYRLPDRYRLRRAPNSSTGVYGFYGRDDDDRIRDRAPRYSLYAEDRYGYRRSRSLRSEGITYQNYMVARRGYHMPEGELNRRWNRGLRQFYDRNSQRRQVWNARHQRYEWREESPIVNRINYYLGS